MIVRVEQLVKRYQELVALDHFSLQVQEGEILGLLGPNGSGKTTAINCMLSLLKYDKGSVELFGEPMRPDAYEIKKQIGVVFQNIAVFEELSVEENVRYFCSLYVKDKAERERCVEWALDFVGLREFRGFRPRKLSGGMLRRLNIACGIAHHPKLSFMNEPTVAVDPQSRNNILEGIVKLNEQGATVIYTSHYMEEVEQLCTRIVILDDGRVVACGTKEELKEMIALREKITIEDVVLSEEQRAMFEELPALLDLQYHSRQLRLSFGVGSGHLESLLGLLRRAQISYGKIYSEQPTLNDVFLEITGRELRDDV